MFLLELDIIFSKFDIKCKTAMFAMFIKYRNIKYFSSNNIENTMKMLSILILYYQNVRFEISVSIIFLFVSNLKNTCTDIKTTLNLFQIFHLWSYQISILYALCEKFFLIIFAADFYFDIYKMYSPDYSIDYDGTFYIIYHQNKY